MRRLHLVEIEDQPWCPSVIRNGITDYLQFIIKTAQPYSAVANRLSATLRLAGTCDVVDLCSGARAPGRLYGSRSSPREEISGLL